MNGTAVIKLIQIDEYILYDILNKIKIIHRLSG